MNNTNNEFIENTNNNNINIKLHYLNKSLTIAAKADEKYSSIVKKNKSLISDDILIIKNIITPIKNKLRFNNRLKWL